MSISPEIWKIPETIGVFKNAGLVGPISRDLFRGGKRDFYSDAGRLLGAYEEHVEVRMSGIENITPERGGLVVYNHPRTSILLPSLSKLMIEISGIGGKTAFVMGSEIPLFGRFNKYPLPLSVPLLKRIHRMYPDNIISCPTAKSRDDYLTGRTRAALLVVQCLKKGGFVVISPEGHVEIGNTISPKETFHAGAGELAIIATKKKIPIYPVGIWKERKGIINVTVGSPFGTITPNRREAANDLMRHVADLLPQRLRGPYAGGQIEKVFV